MNICFGIFVVLALVASASCAKEQTSQKKDFLTTLSGYGAQPGYGMSPAYGSTPAYGNTQYSANYFYSALLNLPIPDAIRAVAETDHAGIVDCPYGNSKWKCDPYSPWRTIDGSCNNLKFPWWGASHTLYKRILPPAYDGYNSAPRSRGSNGYPLENPRTIALKVHYPKDIYVEFSAFFPQFGQFVNHDLSLFGEIKNKDGSLLKCKCSKKTSPDCINMPIPPYDYWNKDKKCLTQARSRPSFPEFNCYTPYREQINEVTSWVDLSQVYGNTQYVADSLREYKNGRLKVSSYDGLDYLPTGCQAWQLTKNICFQTGDWRSNQYPALTNQHTIWVREHNRIADALWRLNPYWSDELTYQTARTINIAQMQNIVYNTFLPILVGKQFATIFQLTSNYDGYFNQYDPYIFPNIANEFSSAAARYGHPLTVPYEPLIDSYYNVYQNISLWELMFNPKLVLNKNFLDGLVRGSVLEKGNWFSTHLTDYLNNDVMVDQGPHNPTTGHSLSALNINRGREHGIAGYNYYRQLAGLPRAKSWEDLTYIPKGAIERLKSVYASVDDIDLFTGGTSEYPLPDGVVGPTFAYILARGYRDWKYGDRWWFENGHDAKTRFPLNQLNELRKSNIGRIICDNTGIKQITLNPFLVESKNNYIVDCKNLPGVNLNLWKDYGNSGSYNKNY